MNLYLTVKAIHIISIIAWIAGLLYLPRIFVYHAENLQNDKICETFKIMEKRLMFYIMNPAMLSSWFFGLWLVHLQEINILDILWIKLKFALVVILTIYHFFLFKCLKNFNENMNNYSSKFYRVINEIPTLLLIFIVFIVVFKPL